MPIEITEIEGIPDGFYATVTGTWDGAAFIDMLEFVEERKPTYLVLDPTDSIIPTGQQRPIEDANEQRFAVVSRIILLMQSNPAMLYIIVNRNDTPILKTSVALYIEAGVGDRYFFVRSREEALELIANHGAS